MYNTIKLLVKVNYVIMWLHINKNVEGRDLGLKFYRRSRKGLMEELCRLN